MDKDKILEMSRKENKNGDLVSLQVAKNSYFIGFAANAAMMLAVMTVELITTGIFHGEFAVAYFFGFAAMNIYRYIKQRNSVNLISTIGSGFPAIVFLVVYIITKLRQG